MAQVFFFAAMQTRSEQVVGRADCECDGPFATVAMCDVQQNACVPARLAVWRREVRKMKSRFSSRELRKRNKFHGWPQGVKKIGRKKIGELQLVGDTADEILVATPSFASI